MNTLNGLPAHILLVHAVVVLLPLAALLLVLCALWPAARRKLAGANAILAAVVVALVPITTEAGEWLEHHVPETALVRTHAELGDTALYAAIPVAVLAALLWVRDRFATPDGATQQRSDSAIKRRIRTLVASRSTATTITLATLSILAAGAAMYDTYRIGDSGAQATWQGQTSSAPDSPASR